MARRLLLPQTYRTIPERDQAPVLKTDFNADLEAAAMAYRAEDHWTAYYLKQGQAGPARRSAIMRDRFYARLKPLLDQLVVR